MAVLIPVRFTRLIAAMLACLATLALSGCYDATCDEGDAEVAQARALPQPVLAALYAEAEAWSRTDGARGRGRKALTTPLPGVEVGRLQLRASSRDHVRVPLRGCLDEEISLDMEGLDTPSGRVVLYWGEGPIAGHQVLWRKSAAATSP